MPNEINVLAENYLFAYRSLPFLVIAAALEFRGLGVDRERVITEITHFRNPNSESPLPIFGIWRAAHETPQVQGIAEMRGSLCPLQPQSRRACQRSAGVRKFRHV